MHVAKRVRPTGRGRGDDGMVVVLVALALVALLVMAAFIIDIGAAQGERRQDQTAADSAALAGASNLQRGSDAAARAAMAAARSNLTTPYTDAGWAALWAGCSDPGALANFPATVNTHCVSFNNGYTLVRVRIPDQVNQTSFGAVVGVKTISTNADATAQMKVIPGNGILPFAVGGFLGDVVNKICYTRDGCGSGSSDLLLAVDSPLTGNPQYGSRRDCPGAGTATGLATRLEYNVAQGIDHYFDVYAPPQRNDDCTKENPNAMWVLSRDYSNDLKVGLVTGPSSGATYPDGRMARLARFPGDGRSSQLPDRSAYSPAWESRTIGPESGTSYRLDNRPLWEFIPVGAPNIPPACSRSNFDNGAGGAVAGGEAKLLACLASYANGNPRGWSPALTARNPSNPDGLYDIQLSTRLGYVPIVATTSIGWQQIEAFKLFFINTVYFDCAGGCDTPDSGGLFRTGEGAVTTKLTTSLTNFQGIAALRVYDAALPQQVIDAGPQNHGKTIPLRLVQ